LILFLVGATASVRGSATFATFATGKFALRALSQSLAREFGPKGVHVSHVIVDGVIDIPRTKDWKFEHPDAKLSPEAVSTFPTSRKECTWGADVLTDCGFVLVLAHATEDNVCV
jgi:short-subunit dehydrogenase